MAVDGRGDFWPCSSLAGREDCLLGNIRDGLPEWMGDQIPSLFAPAQCRSCKDYAQCLGGCPAGRLDAGETDRLTCVMHRVLTEKEELS